MTARGVDLARERLGRHLSPPSSSPPFSLPSPPPRWAARPTPAPALLLLLLAAPCARAAPMRLAAPPGGEHATPAPMKADFAQQAQGTAAGTTIVSTAIAACGAATLATSTNGVTASTASNSWTTDDDESGAMPFFTGGGAAGPAPTPAPAPAPAAVPAPAAAGPAGAPSCQCTRSFAPRNGAPAALVSTKTTVKQALAKAGGN
jgi:hypothetical protein